MLLIHRSLHAISRIASTEPHRYAISCVLIEDAGKDKFRLTATDGKRALQVTARKEEWELPKIRGFDPKANGSNRALVNAQVFGRILREIPKQKSVTGSEYAGATLEKEEITFASTTNDHRMKRVSPIIPDSEEHCKFPPVPGVFPKGAPIMAMDFNPAILANLLFAISEILGRNGRVTLEFYPDKKRPDDAPSVLQGMVIRGKNKDLGFEVEAVIMPLSEG